LSGVTRQLFVYILASKSRRLYVGVTSNLWTRLHQHRAGSSQFTAKYHINRLVYFEQLGPPLAALEREKQIKAFRRSKKIALIEAINPAWDDLSQSWTRW
jgi:putative endonuclease